MLLHKDLREPIYNIYGFVRLADEIVDSFHGYDKKYLLDKFEEDTWEAIATRISLNPILHSFQQTVNKYKIPEPLITSFLYSMRLDLFKTKYKSERELNEYIYGSAEAVGLMCLFVFCDGDMVAYNQLVEPARKLGSAFQKINFLRDMQSDYTELSRAYFPGIDVNGFNEESKRKIEMDLESDFRESLAGIRKLPWKARLGVFTAYRYYQQLFRKIRSMRPKAIMEQRVRVPNIRKLAIVMQAGIYNKLNLI
jgi:phytoene/squalene synthetase